MSGYTENHIGHNGTLDAGHHPAPEALYPPRTEGKGAGDARYSTPSGDTNVCSFSSISSNRPNS